MMTSLPYLLPPLVLSAFAFVLFGVDAYNTGRSAASRKIELTLATLGILGALVVIPVTLPGSSTLFGRNMLIWDGTSYFITWIALLTTLLVVFLSSRHKPFDGMSLSVYFGLLLLAAVGLIFVASANDFLMVFLAIELVGVPSFILTGYLRRKETSSEGAIKFFLIGAFSSAMLAYGISILYGLTGSTSLTTLRLNVALLGAHAPLALLAMFFIVVSFGFKVALVPFHMWVPDAFEGAPTPIAAFLSVAPKVAGAALVLRVFNFTLSEAPLGLTTVLAILAALTMTVGNIVGLQQKNVIRLLAYSSIAHMGYLFLGLVAGGVVGASTVYLYGWAYLFMNLGVFAIVISLSDAMGSSDLSSFAGLGKRAPFMSALLVLFLISLAGIPPTAGFIAKFYVFSVAYNAGWLWLVVLGAINSVISVGYYFKILHAMYFQAPASAASLEMDLLTRCILGVTSFATLSLGISPQPFLVKVQNVAMGLQAQVQQSSPATPLAPEVSSHADSANAEAHP